MSQCSQCLLFVENIFSITRDLYISKNLLAFNLVLKTHLFPIKFPYVWWGASSYVPLSIIELNFDYIFNFHLGMDNTSLVVKGSSKISAKRYDFGFKVPCMDRVDVGSVLEKEGRWWIFEVGKWGKSTLR